VNLIKEKLVLKEKRLYNPRNRSDARGMEL